MCDCTGCLLHVVLCVGLAAFGGARAAIRGSLEAALDYRVVRETGSYGEVLHGIISPLLAFVCPTFFFFIHLFLPLE